MGPGPLVSRLARVGVRAEPGKPYITQATDSAVMEVGLLQIFIFIQILYLSFIYVNLDRMLICLIYLLKT